MSDVAAIILAAGRGARFGSEPKLLASIGGKPLVRHVAEAAAASLAEPVIVITGHRADEIEAALKGLPLRIVHNPSFADGISTSLKAGFSHLPPNTEAAIILLGDMPLITADLIDCLADRWLSSGKPAALVPTLDGQRGNPVVLSRELEESVRKLSGDSGAGPILRERSDIVEWPTNDRVILQDIDTKDTIRQLQSWVGENRIPAKPSS